MLHLIKEVRDLNRFRQILAVLLEEGFGFLLSRLDLKQHIPFVKRIKTKISKQQENKPEVKLRRTIERLGPTFIKLGQVLSVRPDLVPKEFCKELEKLQDKVPPFPYPEVREIIERELGKKIEDLFKDFDKTPVASASISQVHKATLKTGEKVAVKVQRPNVKKLMETDVEIMFYFAKALESQIEGLKRYKPVRIVQEFKEWTEKGLDFRIEARNAKRFYQNFKGSKTVHIPKVYDNYSSEKVLALEFIEGIELHDISGIKKRKLDFDKIMKNGFDAIMTQVFVHGIFHADPHPGNIIVQKDNSVSFIDFGIVGYFDESLKNRCIDLLYGIVDRNVDMIMDTLMSMGMEGSDVDFEELKSDISFIIEPLQQSTIQEVKISRVTEEILSIAIRHRLKVPASMVLFGKTIVTLEGVALEYDPNFKFVEATRPFVEKLILKRKNPAFVFKRFVHDIHKYRKFAENFPDKAERVLEKIQKGSFKVDIEDTDIRKLSLELDRSSNRIAYGMLIAALLVTSALLIQVQKGPTVLGVPILSFISFLFAMIFSLFLFFSIIREKFRHM